MKRGVLPKVLEVQTITRLLDLKPGDIVITMSLHVVNEDDEVMKRDWIPCTDFDHVKNQAQPWPYIKGLGMGQQCVAKVLNVVPVKHAAAQKGT